MKLNNYIAVLYYGFLDMTKTRVKLFWDIEPEKIDLNYWFDLYLKDRDKWLEYIYKNIWYMIRWSKFKFMGYSEDMDMTSEVMLLIDRKLQEQIKKYNIREHQEPRMAKRTMCYIMVCIRWVMFNAVNAANNEWIVLDDEELYDMDWWISTSLDEDHELEYMKYKIVYWNERDIDERNIVILYLEWTPKRDIARWLWYWRPYIDKVVNKLKIIVYDYLKWDVNYAWTIKRTPPETKSKSDSIRENDNMKLLLNI